MPHRFFNLLLDILFPWKCVVCRKEITGSYPLCPQCQKLIILNKTFFCPACRRKIVHWTRHPCSCHDALFALGAVASYENQALQQSIHFFKYQRIISLQKPLADLMIRFLQETNFLSGLRRQDLLVVPIPLHSLKRRGRGFNQSDLLAQRISSHFSWRYDATALRRIRHHPPQAKISDFKKRAENVQDIFQLDGNPAKIKNKLILLIDDVYTSGSTMREAAKVLKQNGARQIIGLVLAQG